MTFEELQDFLHYNQPYQWRVKKEEEECFHKAVTEGTDPFAVISGMEFRNTNLPWYLEEESRATHFTTEKLRELTPEEMRLKINKGLDVDCITRITGYFAKTKGFNPGKTGELKDRYKPELNATA